MDKLMAQEVMKKFKFKELAYVCVDLRDQLILANERIAHLEQQSCAHVTVNDNEEEK